MGQGFHILNGDSLNDRFPSKIKGTAIVFRECLVDGPVDQEILEDFFEERAEFVTSEIADFSKEEYQQESEKEIRKILEIPKGSSIYLWFEDDLFCQVNLWFVLNLIENHLKDYHLFLIRPETDLQYGFASLNENGLIEAYKERLPILNLSALSRLWTFYQKNNQTELVGLSLELSANFPFIAIAVEAHLARIPNGSDKGRPIRVIKEIMRDLNTQEFPLVFREFHKREPVYGFGDLQVKRLFEKALLDS